MEKPRDVDGKPFTRRVEQGCTEMRQIDHLLHREWLLKIESVTGLRWPDDTEYL